jgi:hypothetical protein
MFIKLKIKNKGFLLLLKNDLPAVIKQKTAAFAANMKQTPISPHLVAVSCSVSACCYQLQEIRHNLIRVGHHIVTDITRVCTPTSSRICTFLALHSKLCFYVPGDADGSVCLHHRHYSLIQVHEGVSTNTVEPVEVPVEDDSSSLRIDASAVQVAVNQLLQ